MAPPLLLPYTRPVSTYHRRRTLKSMSQHNTMSKPLATRIDSFDDDQKGPFAQRRDRSSALGRNGAVASCGVEPPPVVVAPARHRTQPQISYAQRAKRATQQTPVLSSPPPPSSVEQPSVKTVTLAAVAPSTPELAPDSPDSSLSSMDEDSDDDVEIITISPASSQSLPSLDLARSERPPTPSLSTTSSASSVHSDADLLTPRDLSASPPPVCKDSADSLASSTSTITVSLPSRRDHRAVAPLLPDIPFASLNDPPACDYGLFAHVDGSEMWHEEGALEPVVVALGPVPQPYTEMQQVQQQPPTVNVYEPQPDMNGYHAQMMHQHQQQPVPQFYYMSVPMMQQPPPSAEPAFMPPAGFAPYPQHPVDEQAQAPNALAQPFVPHGAQFQQQRPFTPPRRPSMAGNRALSGGGTRPFAPLPGYGGRGGGRGRGRGGYGFYDGGRRGGYGERKEEGGGRERSGSGGTGGGVPLGTAGGGGGGGRRNSVRERREPQTQTA